jgi:hypothetical protein
MAGLRTLRDAEPERDGAVERPADQRRPPVVAAEVDAGVEDHLTDADLVGDAHPRTDAPVPSSDRHRGTLTR